MNRTRPSILPAGAILLYLLLCGGFNAAAGREEITFEHLTVADGLPASTVMWILQDHLGFLWFSTANGLVKYDGYTFTIYAPEPDNPGSLSDSNPMELVEDQRGDLWIGTSAGGLNRLDRRSETFQGCE